MEIAVSKGSWSRLNHGGHHFSNKTGPSILVNVISPYHTVYVTGFMKTGQNRTRTEIHFIA